jgi:hypothetical protein
MLASVASFALAGLLAGNRTNVFPLPAVLLVYLGLALFLRPFDGPLGAFPPAAIEAARGRSVAVPSPFIARDELYRFHLPGADVRRIRPKDLAEALAGTDSDLIIFPVTLAAPPIVPGFRVLGSRLRLNDHFNAEQTADLLRGNIARQLFQRELLVERVTSAPR